MKNENIRADEIYLASSKELFEEAGEIAQNTQTEEKYSFILQYNANQREFVQSILETVGAIVNNDNLEECLLSVMMNMTQLAFIKCLDCVERVKTDEVHNPYLIEDEVNDIDDRMIVEASTAHVGMTTNDVQVMSLASEELGQDEVATTASYATSATSADCPCSTNTSMSTAKVISDEGSVGGYICCPCTEQWFKFTATRTGRYTIGSTGSKDTIGTLYDGNGNKIAENDDFAPGGKINFRIVIDLAAGNTYYVKVRLHGNATGRYTLRVTERLYVNYVRINMDRITLQKGVTYELPITPFYVYKGYNGAQPISGLDVSVIPSNADEQKIWWYSQSNDVFTISHGSDEDGNRYAHLVVTGVGDANLYAVDWNENGKRDECVVHSQYSLNWPECDEPIIKSRESWGARNVVESRLVPRVRDPQLIVFHHTADIFTSTVESDIIDEIQETQNEHIDGGEKCDIAYHFIIDPNGGIWQGAMVDDYKRGHAEGHFDDIGVVLLGDFESRIVNLWSPNSLNDNQKEAMKELSKWLCYRYDLPVNNSPIATHKSASGGTECPGDNAEGWINNDLKNYINELIS